MASYPELKICILLLMFGVLSGMDLKGSLFKILDDLENNGHGDENVDKGDESDIQQVAKNFPEIRDLLSALEQDILSVDDVVSRQNCGSLLSKCGAFYPCCPHDSKHKGPLCCKYTDGESPQRGNDIYQKFGRCLPASLYCNNKPIVP